MLLLLSALSVAAAAQASLSISKTLNSQHSHHYLLVVDHGPVSVPVDVTVSFHATNGSLSVELYDLDEWATDASGSWMYAIGDSSTPAAFTLSLPARMGAHELLFSVGSTQAPTDYSGSVATSGGTMQQAGFRDYFATLGPYNVDLFGRTLAFNTWPNYVTDLKFEFMLDFGSVVHSTTLNIYHAGGADFVTRVRLLNVTNGVPVELAVAQDASGSAFLHRPVTTPPYSGLQRFRIDYDSDTAVQGFAVLAFGSDVELGSYGLAIPERGSDNEGGCAARDTKGPASAALIGATLAVVAIRRRRSVAAR
jgi:hypothetical protein